ncbi:RCC1 repeat-containing protein [bacterium]|nr:RCC1 repeat-containing protein [bacterium]
MRAIMKRTLRGSLTIVAVSLLFVFWIQEVEAQTPYGWGLNYYGELGNGLDGSYETPGQVTALSGVRGMSAGSQHTLAIASDKTVVAYGDNTFGQLGNGTNERSASPVAVLNLTNIKQVASGGWHSLALTEDGYVWAWGWGFFGQLGDGTNSDQCTEPVQVLNLTNVIAISAGNSHSLALCADETVWSWGYNGDGALGDGTNDSSNVPVQVLNLSGITAIAAGFEHCLALKGLDQTVWSWGLNFDGQLGDGTNASSNVPVQVLSLNTVQSIAGGGFHSLAVLDDTTVWAWGANINGQLGDGTTTGTNVAVQVSGLSGVDEVVGGADHSLALSSSGTLVAWGLNEDGQLGDGTNTGTTVPVSVTVLTNMDTLVAGHYHSTALGNDGLLWSWGSNKDGQLGFGILPNSNVPDQVLNLTDVVALTGGDEFSLALAADGTVWGWGKNDLGQLGDGTNSSSVLPVQVGSLANVCTIAAGLVHGLALKTDGTVWAWGANGNGQLGDGTNLDTNTPVQVLTLDDITDIGAGAFHSLAVHEDGTVWVWGLNNYGQLGLGDTLSINTPAQIQTLSAIDEVEGGFFHSLALSETGLVWTWGRNNQGQLGIGSTSPSTSTIPILIDNFTEIASIGAGSYHSLAVKEDGSAWAWGYNNNGQLGDGPLPSIRQTEPVPVSEIDGIVAMTGGNYHTVALINNGTVWAWGDNKDGKLGDGTFLNSNVPVQTLDLVGAIAIGSGYYHSLAALCDLPDQPVITQIVDNDPCLPNGITITFSPGYPATRHDLYQDGVLVIADVTSPLVYDPGDLVSHNYVIRTVANYETCYAESDSYPFADEVCDPPPEIAPGDTPENGQNWSQDKNLQSWPPSEMAAGYKLYRGTFTELPGLLTGTMNSCLRYEGTATTVDLSADDPSLEPEKMYWYIVTGTNPVGEGSAGYGTDQAGLPTSRMINTSGQVCPETVVTSALDL